MSQQKQKEGEGVLFKNKRQRDSKDPGYQGSITIGGVEYWLSAWLNEAKTTNEKYFGLRVKRKSDQSTASSSQPPPSSKPDPQPEEDDVPF